MIRFHPLKIRQVRNETPECVSVSFEVPDEIKQEFLFRQGQSLTVRAIINGQEVRRSYSICSSPIEEELRIAIKKVEQGVFSSYANNQLKSGDVIEAMPPVGKFFTELNASNKKSYMAFAAGSGITPILSIIKTALAVEHGSEFTLVYGNRSRSSIIFKEEIEGLKNKYLSRFKVIHILSREKMDTPLHFGRIDKEKCLLLFDKLLSLTKTDEFFLCGPEEMIFTVKGFLEEHGVDRKKIHFELFGSSRTNKLAIGPSDRRNEATSKVVIKLDGMSFDFELPFDGDSILDAALKLGADLPFACKGGVCCTCRAKLTEGSVDMDMNYALEPEELEQGFILTCQSHPRTAKVMIDYDVK